MTYLLSATSGFHSSTLGLLGVLFAAAMCVLLLLLPRERACLPFALTACYMTFGQQLLVAGLHFTILRILVGTACLRLVLRGEYSKFTWSRLDTTVIFWSLSSIVTYTILWGSTAATVNRLGVACDTAGLYFIFRVLVRQSSDVKAACNIFALCLAPLALCMLAEHVSGGKNVFYALGGVPEMSEIRRGVVRCQGPFAHPILAGTFGAVWIAPFLGMFHQAGRDRLIAIVGLVSAGIITVTAGSSGPIITLGVGVIATLMWFARQRLRLVRWGIVALLGLLHAAMTDPVWFIFARINVLSGSTGWHRSNLIDQTIRHVTDWWLVGTKDVGKWGVWAGDITNQFILEGVNGGLITAGLFLAIFVVSFRRIGDGIRTTPVVLADRKVVWAIGATLLSHGLTLLSVSYFDQNVVALYLCFAMVPAVCSTYIGAPVRQELTTVAARREEIQGACWDKDSAVMTWTIRRHLGEWALRRPGASVGSWTGRRHTPR